MSMSMKGERHAIDVYSRPIDPAVLFALALCWAEVSREGGFVI
jgi:hypothetical protein